MLVCSVFCHIGLVDGNKRDFENGHTILYVAHVVLRKGLCVACVRDCDTGAMGINKVTSSNICKFVWAASWLDEHSPLATRELNKKHEEMGIMDDNSQPLQLVQYVKTRWNSVFEMFDHLVKLLYLASMATIPLQQMQHCVKVKSEAECR